MSKPERLDKILSNMGLGTRTEVRRLIRAGLVECGGEVVTRPEAKFDAEGTAFAADGRDLAYRRHIYVIMHKPEGVVSATEDAKYRTAVDLLPAELRARNPFPVGRLDIDTTGLLFLTDDGELAHRLISPKYHVEKEYEATLDAPPGADVADGFLRGVALKGEKPCKPARLIYPVPNGITEMPDHTYAARVILTEGKFHQVKRMFAVYGIHVLALKRIRFGGLTLDPALAPGESRVITEKELSAITEAERSVLTDNRNDTGGRSPTAAS